MKTLSECLKEYIESIKIEDMVIPYNVFQEIIDPKFKDKIIFEEIKNSKLYLKAVHPSYKQLFKMQENQFLKEIQEKLSDYDIKKIVYKN